MGKQNGSDRIFTNPEYRGMMGEHRDLTILSDLATYLQLSVGITTFFPKRTQKLLLFTPKLPTAAVITKNTHYIKTSSHFQATTLMIKLSLCRCNITVKSDVNLGVTTQLTREKESNIKPRWFWWKNKVIYYA